MPLLLQSNGLALAGILLAFLLYGLRLATPESLRRAAGPAYTLLARKFYIDELYMLLVRGLFFTTTTAIAWFDRHVVDGVVNLVGAVSKKGGDILRRTVTGKVQGYALVVFCGVVVALVVLFIVSRGQILSSGAADEASPSHDHLLPAACRGARSCSASLRAASSRSRWLPSAPPSPPSG